VSSSASLLEFDVAGNAFFVTAPPVTIFFMDFVNPSLLKLGCIHSFYIGRTLSIELSNPTAPTTLISYRLLFVTTGHRDTEKQTEVS